MSCKGRTQHPRLQNFNLDREVRQYNILSIKHTKGNTNLKKKDEEEMISQSGLANPKEGKVWSVLGRQGGV